MYRKEVDETERIEVKNIININWRKKVKPDIKVLERSGIEKLKYEKTEIKRNLE